MSAFFDGLIRDFTNNLLVGDRYLLILDGLKTTLIIATGAAIIGVFLGIILALMRLSHVKLGKKWYILRSISGAYVNVVRGTPMVVQLMMMYYVILSSTSLSKTTISILSFGLNSGAYVSEMIRGGILAVDKGQEEAGRSLGLSRGLTMRHIILPQSIRIAIPSLFNEFIMLLKETSIVGFIGLMDLTKASDFIRSRTYSAFFPLLIVAVIYLMIVTVLTAFFTRLERRLRAGANK